MDDSCAVCAESLEWVAYGACGHKDVCSNCVARLRFICDDRRCCICKTESNVVFVTKALGAYTKTISDFSLFPSKVKEGRVENYWYHEDTQSFFDDLDHYKMIKAMCRLSCGVCDKMEDHPDDGSRRRAEFRNIEQLKAHLFHKHRLMMCSLCLEGRKVFICEQKLYTRSQLTQHTNTGDSEVDGTESERGGFMGHPRCEFCGTPFYGDNELYTHMSTEHYICHICQRQHPGQYEYYKNYDDLEIHFRRDHFLCEDEECLGKKFIVFQSEAELKRHNTLEHGGRMSRSKRSAALQASSLETANAAPFSTRTASDRGESVDVDTLVPPLESLTTVSEPPSRYLQALSHNSTGAALEEVSFPPLPVNPGSSQQNSHSDVQPKRTMAALLRHQGNRKGNASSSAPAPSWPGSSRKFAQPESNSLHDWPSIDGASGSASGPGLSRPARESGHTPSGRSVSAQSRTSLVTDSSSTASLVSSRMSGSTSRIRHSLSASNLSECGSLESSSGDFPQLTVAQTRELPSSDHNMDKVKDVQTANKSLVDKIRLALGFDEEKFTIFKEISGEYRQGSMDAETYLAHAVQFGLSHLVPELANLLPNAQKQRALIEAYHGNLVESAPRDDGWNNGIRLKNSKDSKKGKGKSIDSGSSVAKNSLADNIISTVNELQSNYRASEEPVPVLSKDGYRSNRGKSKAVVDDLQFESSGPAEFTNLESDSYVIEANEKSGHGNGKGKQKKKTSKFHRVRLGDGSVEALLDRKSADHDPDPGPNIKDFAASSGPNMESLPARGVWRNGGGQKLVMMTSREPKK
ncbi:Alpha/beta-Hydrolases superfamily protein isoform 1 [Dorcoceras hygrometricum]|nr:Alpha/beta-Hydrolases superfamily protein isoform 1 [Dorcoceras hygrometricum]